jgi:hypothetical protein
VVCDETGTVSPRNSGETPSAYPWRKVLAMATENIFLLVFAAVLGTLHLVGGSLSPLARPAPKPPRRRYSVHPVAPPESDEPSASEQAPAEASSDADSDRSERTSEHAERNPPEAAA